MIDETNTNPSPTDAYIEDVWLAHIGHDLGLIDQVDGYDMVRISRTDVLAFARGLLDGVAE